MQHPVYHGLPWQAGLHLAPFIAPIPKLTWERHRPGGYTSAGPQTFRNASYSHRTGGGATALALGPTPENLCTWCKGFSRSPPHYLPPTELGCTPAGNGPLGTKPGGKALALGPTPGSLCTWCKGFSRSALSRPPLDPPPPPGAATGLLGGWVLGGGVLAFCRLRLFRASTCWFRFTPFTGLPPEPYPRLPISPPPDLGASGWSVGFSRSELSGAAKLSRS
jgi:hypothetical protein